MGSRVLSTMILQYLVLFQLACALAYQHKISFYCGNSLHLGTTKINFRTTNSQLSCTNSDSMYNESQNTNIAMSALSGASNFINRTKLWGQYTLALELKPVITKSISSFIGFIIGDILAQAFTKNHKFNFMRCLRMGSLGAVVHGPLGHLFYSNLERRFPGAKATTVGIKILLDQLLWNPLFTVLVITYLGIALGASPYQIYLQSKILYPQIVISSILLWPVSHYVNFKWIPMKQRLLFINVVQVMFNAVVSNLFHTKFRVK